MFFPFLRGTAVFEYIRKRMEERRSNREAQEFGTKVGGEMADAIDGYLNERFETITVGYLRVFKDRLDNLPNEPGVTQKEEARIAFKIFLEQVDELLPKIRAEVSTALPDWYAFANEFDMKSPFNELVEHRLAKATTILRVGGKALLEEHERALS